MMVWRRDEKLGEDLQVPALQVLTDTAGQPYSTCLACRHVWHTGQLEHLARVLGCETITDVGEA